MTIERRSVCGATLLLLVEMTRPAAAQDERCAALFEQAAAELAAEQYAKMLRFAEDRTRLCPDPQSAFLVGLAEANMVESLVVHDPAEREQMRLRALRHLRVAAAGGGLKPVWQFTVHDWIVRLQDIGPAVGPDVEPDPLDGRVEQEADDPVEPLEVPPAPPPQPRPAFPWGPVLTGVVGVSGVVTGIVLGVSASDSRDEALVGAKRLRTLASVLDPQALSEAIQRTRALNAEADRKASWSTALLAVGAAATVGSLVWYFALPPKGKWRWAATPAAVRVSVNF